MTLHLWRVRKDITEWKSQESKSGNSQNFIKNNKKYNRDIWYDKSTVKEENNEGY